MAKRSRKARSKKTQQTAVKPQQSKAAVAPAKSSAAQVAVDFVKDYAYVYDDMRTMFFLTIFMILVMFGLSFVF